jgi:hypothetical protein
MGMINPNVYEGLIYNIRLHSESGELFRCDCGCTHFRQVTDILAGAQGFEVYECEHCKSWYQCNTVGEFKPNEAQS